MVSMSLEVESHIVEALISEKQMLNFDCELGKNSMQKINPGSHLRDIQH